MNWVVVALILLLVARAIVRWNKQRVRHPRELLATGASFIDVDPPSEFASDHPAGAANVPFDELPVRAPDLGPHDHPVVVYGHGLWRSTFAVWRLRAIGFHDVVRLGRRELARA